MKKQPDAPLLFNLFPRHFKSIDAWSESLPQVKKMGFNSIFVNPFHLAGFSGSLYAVKDYYQLNPLFLKKGQDPHDFAPLKKFIDNCTKNDIEVVMDLVINHTSFDSILTASHPEWYRHDHDNKLMHPFAIDPGDPGKVTVWGDLAMIDNENSGDKKGLWEYWDTLVAFYQAMGIKGFRCDAAYQVSASLWDWIIGSAKKRDSSTLFLAETLGCELPKIQALSNCGFDFLFNSSRWWNFDQSWALDQHQMNRKIAPSISFPESHDTERQASVSPRTIEVQKLRYAFAAVFSRGLLMPMGYERGAVTRMDVVKGTLKDVDKPQWDLVSWIGEINALKLSKTVLGDEGVWRALNDFNLPFIFLEKTSDDGSEKAIFCINKSAQQEVAVKSWMIPEDLHKCKNVYQLMSAPQTAEDIPAAFSLDPADILMFM